MGYSDQLTDAAAQITAATKGQFLGAYNAIAHSSAFFNAPATVGSANLLAAYWLAVAARLGYTKLLVQANRAYQAARSGSTSSSSVERTAVLRAAISALDSVGAKSDRRVAPIYALLSSAQSEERQALSEQIAYERSTTGQIVGAAAATGKTLASGLESGGRLLTGERPPGTPPWLWWVQRNAFWATVIGGVGFVGYLYLRPMLPRRQRED